jgi:hypothetical protein
MPLNLLSHANDQTMSVGAVLASSLAVQTRYAAATADANKAVHPVVPGKMVGMPIGINPSSVKIKKQRKRKQVHSSLSTNSVLVPTDTNLPLYCADGSDEACHAGPYQN